MKKSKIVNLVLITAALASCHKPQKQSEWQNANKVYMRADSTGSYSQARMSQGYMNDYLLWYYCFRPYGYYDTYGTYRSCGYYSSAISEHSNIGSSAAKASVVRGGFGSGAYSVSS